MVTVDHTARAYSFATPPDSSRLEFLIDTRPNGIGSRFWQQASAGQIISLTAPYGHFFLDTVDQRPLLFVGGSTGLAPLVSHLLWLRAQNRERPLTLIAGHSQAPNAFWESKLLSMSTTYNFNFHHVIGPLTSTLTSIPSLADHTAYICGSAPMVTSTAETLYQHSLPPRFVHYELFT